ncbi:hypothetical protein MVEN_01089100 [Mycena venus]|uniref:Uncharacterized protein n=1 Tax=Mycena venus TaxID=2733690 RepID=A0A8H6Y682_9AGAR|nr:hypothetical protein MVEN_01089100 [Mycena venus]
MPRYSELFHPQDADVTFQSCDGVLFGIHRPNLQTNTESFPPPEISTDGDIFIYPRRHPALDGIAFADLAALAEAAEKYQVFSAMNICRIRMRDVLPDHAPEVLTYAAKHDYPFLVYEAAPHTFDVPLADVVAVLPAHLILPWVKYIDAWNAVLHDTIAVKQRTHYNSTQNAQCRFCKAERPVIAQHFGHSLRSLRQLDNIFADHGTKMPACCEEGKVLWRMEIETAMEQIPPFTSFVSPASLVTLKSRYIVSRVFNYVTTFDTITKLFQLFPYSPPPRILFMTSSTQPPRNIRLVQIVNQTEDVNSILGATSPDPDIELASAKPDEYHE